MRGEVGFVDPELVTKGLKVAGLPPSNNCKRVSVKKAGPLGFPHYPSGRRPALTDS